MSCPNLPSLLLARCHAAAFPEVSHDHPVTGTGKDPCGDRGLPGSRARKGPRARAMSIDAAAEAQRHLTSQVFRQSDLGLDALWIHYFSIGGDAGPLEIDAYLHDSYMLRPVQRDLLDHAIEEMGEA